MAQILMIISTRQRDFEGLDIQLKDKLITQIKIFSNEALSYHKI
jgi:hypothetical protein